METPLPPSLVDRKRTNAMEIMKSPNPREANFDTMSKTVKCEVVTTRVRLCESVVLHETP